MVNREFIFLVYNEENKMEREEPFFWIGEVLNKPENNCILHHAPQRSYDFHTCID